MGEAIYQADFLFLGNGEMIKKGMLKCDAYGRILDLGEQIETDDISVKRIEGGLTPGFINTHCHLELSHLHQKVPRHQGLHGFIPSLQSQRKMEVKEIDAAIGKWDNAMQKAGIVAVGDITNSLDTLAVKKSSPIYYHSFIELFGLRKAKVEEIFEKGLAIREAFEKEGLACSLSPHAPYSLSDELFTLIAEQSKGKAISIHNQESEGELEMFRDQSGPLQEMLENFGNQRYELQRAHDNSLMHALHFFPADQKLLLVHNTFTSREDIEKAEAENSNLYWCFCPQANWYIEKRLPKLPLFAEKGLRCTLGTDSLASNQQLSILEEIKLIKTHFPEIQTSKMIQWACANGAEFLGLNELGKLKLGGSCGLNQITNLSAEGEVTEDSEVHVIY